MLEDSCSEISSLPVDGKFASSPWRLSASFPLGIPNATGGACPTSLTPSVLGFFLGESFGFFSCFSSFSSLEASSFFARPRLALGGEIDSSFGSTLALEGDEVDLLFLVGDLDDERVFMASEREAANGRTKRGESDDKSLEAPAEPHFATTSFVRPVEYSKVGRACFMNVQTCRGKVGSPKIKGVIRPRRLSSRASTECA